MHFEAYEWELYLRGCLSKRREAEMEQHLAGCDTCLQLYTKLASGESFEEKKQPRRSRLPLGAARTSRVQRWAGLALGILLVFFAVSFTPFGRIALANFIQSLEKFGNILGESFGVGD